LADDHVLYFLASRPLFREGKINVLSAKSSVLKSRERIKKIIELREIEHDLRKKIVKSVSLIRTKIKDFHKSLPKTREEMPKKLKDPELLDQPEIRRARKSIYKDEIAQEIDRIEQKLAQLGAVV